MWAKPRLDIRPGALLLFSLAWFFDGEGLAAAVLPAAAVHELGHILALRLGKLRLRSLKLGMFGLELDYFGLPGKREAAAAILAGPLFGLVWALAGAVLPGEYWRLSSGLSFCLSLVNLMPVLPLDGGRLLVLLLGEKGRGVSRFFALAACAGCFALFAFFHTLPPLVMGFGLLRENSG